MKYKRHQLFITRHPYNSLGALRALTHTLHYHTACKIQNCRHGSEIGRWDVGYTQLSLKNKFFDLSTPSMRKVDDGGKKIEEKKREKKIMSFIVATNVVASRLPEHRLTGTPHTHGQVK